MDFKHHPTHDEKVLQISFEKTLQHRKNESTQLTYRYTGYKFSSPKHEILLRIPDKQTKKDQHTSGLRNHDRRKLVEQSSSLSENRFGTWLGILKNVPALP